MSILTVGSMFAGIGGICLGFKQAGFNITWANEFNKYACQTYRHNLGNDYLIEGDIQKINLDNIPDFDILTAGFPCQSFSIAGKQLGFNDKRGNLFFEISKIIDKKRPQVIFLENVENLIKHNNEKTFLVVYSTLSQFGYNVRYKVMSSNEYGNIPQKRKRIYIIAFQNELACEKFSFPPPIDLTNSIHKIINRSDRKIDTYYYNKENKLYSQLSLAMNDCKSIYSVYNGTIRRISNFLCPTLVASMGNFDNRVPLIKDNYGIRKLTLRECLDMQGFPRDFHFPNSVPEKEAYKQIGNSVSVPVINRIAKQLLEVMP